jgi:hypothetical protein
MKQSESRRGFALLVSPLWAVALGLLALAAGLGLIEAIRFVLVVAVGGLPGIIVVAHLMRNWEEIDQYSIHTLGIPLGLVISVGTQQILVAVGVGSFGWVVPALCALFFALRVTHGVPLQGRSHKDQRRNLVLLVAVASLTLADVDWAFLIMGVTLVVLLFIRARSFYVLLPLAALGTRGAIADYWYLISDDRLFEEAYSRAIFSFGFWDWYGTSSTWVPYHWFAHALGGVFQSTVTEESFVAVGILPILLASMILASSSWLIIRSQVKSKRLQIVCLFVLPFLGVWFQGISNSADFAIALGVWSLAFVIVLAQRPLSWLAAGVLSLAMSSVMLTKVSTGLIVMVGALIFVTATLWSARERDTSNARWLIPFLATGIVFFANYDLLHFSNVDDSRSKIVLLLGGSTLSSYSFWGVRLIGTIAYGAALGMVPLILLIRALFIKGKSIAVVLLVATMVGTGIAIRLLTISYNNESYLESAILCSLPLVLALVADSLESSSKNRILFIGVPAGVVVGLVQPWSTQVNSGLQTTLLVKFVNSPLLILAVGLLLGIVYFGIVTRTSTRLRILMSMSLVMLLGLSAYSGPDLYRLGRQVQSGDIWTETGFGETDRFFFGSKDESEAALWLQENSDNADLIATNHICNLGEGCALDGQSPISAWSRLRGYVEAERFATGRRVDEVLNGDQEPRGHPAWLNNRKAVVLDFATDQSLEHVEELRQAGVDWFWLDLTRDGAMLTDPSLVAIQTTSIAVLKLQPDS